MLSLRWDGSGVGGIWQRRDVDLNTHLSYALMKYIWRVFNLAPFYSQANIANVRKEGEIIKLI